MYLVKHHRRRRRAGRRLEFLELETRWLLAPVFIPPDSESDGPLIQPPVIQSVNGVLRANVDLIRAGDKPGSSPSILYGGKPLWSGPEPSAVGGPQAGTGESGNNVPPHLPLDFAAAYQFTTADGRVLPAQFPGPTLRIQPGDTLDLTIHNSLGDLPHPGIDSEFLESNLHTHGMVVDEKGNGDNVYRVLKPGGTIRTQVEVPATHQPGLDWYHPHHHMATSDQVNGGLAGAIQVGDPLDPWPQFVGKYDERLLALTTPFIDPKTRVLEDPTPNVGNALPIPATVGTPYDDLDFPAGTGKPTWRKYVNGQFFPTLTLRPGETQIWTFLGFERNGGFNLGVTDADGQHPWSATILSYDGNERNVLPRPIKLSLPENPSGTDPFQPDLPMTVDPGARLTLAVTAPTTPGTYYLVDDYTLANLPYYDMRDGQFKSFALATIHVEGDPATEPAPVFTPTGPIPDVYTAIPDQKRTFNFQVDKSGPVATLMINGFSFPDGPMITMLAGQVEEWTLVNPSNVDHPFHIHQTDFAVVSINGQPVNTQGKGIYPYVSLRDTVNIPAGGNVVIRFRVSPEVGKFVFHCHILAHEDAGMMMAVLVEPDASERRVALGAGAGEGGSVLVRDGHGKQIGRLDPLPRGWKGGVATATGDLNGDLVQDIVVGPASPGAKGYVTIYDGKTLRPIRRFLPFPAGPRGGVSLAIGDIDGSGKGNIVVARVGFGHSLVRIFRPDGTLWRQLIGVLPGSFPNGVTVASADFNGDNFDDIAIGGGKGREPVVVGLDGFSLGNPTGSRRVPLFAFVAPGGRGAGVNLAAGYYDPQLHPGLPSFLANLITTPQSGRLAGTVSVWTVPLPAPMATGPGHGTMHSMAASSLPAPKLMATLHPLGFRAQGGLRLAVTRLGKQGLDALAAWTSNRRPVYQSIDDAGVVSTVRTPVP